MKRIFLPALFMCLALNSNFVFSSQKEQENDNNKKSAEPAKPKAIKSKMAIAARLMRLAGNVAELLESQVDSDDEELSSVISVAKKVGKYTKAITNKHGQLDWDKLNKFAANPEIRKKMVFTLLRKLNLSEAEIVKYVDMNQAISAIEIDFKTQKMNFNKKLLLKAIKNEAFSKKVAGMLDVPSQAIQDPLDLAKELLGEKQIKHEDAFKPELIAEATALINKYTWWQGALTGFKNTATVALSASGAYLAFSNPFSALPALAFTGAYITYYSGDQMQKDITARIAQEEASIEAQNRLQREFIETYMKMNSLRAQTINLGTAIAARYLISDEDQKADDNQQNQAIQTRLQSQYAKDMGNFILAIQNNQTLKDTIPVDQDSLLQYLLQPYSLLDKEEIITNLTESEKAQYINILANFITETLNPAVSLQVRDALTVLKVKPKLLITNMSFLKALDTEQIRALYGVLELSGVRSIAEPRFDACINKYVPVSDLQRMILGYLDKSIFDTSYDYFVEKISDKIKTLSNPGLILIAKFNPVILAQEAAFLESIADKEDAQKDLAALLKS